MRYTLLMLVGFLFLGACETEPMSRRDLLPGYIGKSGEILVILTITQIFAIQHYGITVVIRSLEK